MNKTIDKPRYSRISDIIELVIFMQSKPQGVTLKDIEEKFGISRRTAERMRDSILDVFPQIDKLKVDDKYAHWGFTGGYLSELINFSADEIALLETLKVATSDRNHKNNAELLDNISTKIKAFSRKPSNQIDNNLEILLQAQGYAIKQAPQNKINLKHLALIKEAIMNSKKLSAEYKDKKRLLSPLGLIYGDKIYLVAREYEKGPGNFNYSLHKFSKLELSDISFDRGDFDLTEYSQKAFGVYHGEIYDVKLKFSPKVKEKVLNFNFHPTQKIKPQEDGTVTVYFKASGSREICWHLFKWGASVEILAPEVLKNEYVKMLNNALIANK
jgi:predicted DNA-binding transcriptional regulator YafY